MEPEPIDELEDDGVLEMEMDNVPDSFANKPAAMSEEVFKLMGEANNAYVANKHEEAWNMCKEVIRQFPDIADPYLTMALVAEEKGTQVALFKWCAWCFSVHP